MRAELSAICEIRNISNTEDSGRRIEEIDKDTEIFLIKQNERDEDLLLEVTKMHITIVKSLWQIKLQKDTNLVFQDMDIDSNMNK